ncbi:MAG: hypothetical protein K2W95_10945 [Candidatus Obscuribacterales bacterium]|nr:hypothetical protein [Candidatus Obscuribacterales bacterium]
MKWFAFLPILFLLATSIQPALADNDRNFSSFVARKGCGGRGGNSWNGGWGRGGNNWNRGGWGLGGNNWNNCGKHRGRSVAFGHPVHGFNHPAHGANHPVYGVYGRRNSWTRNFW